MKIQTPFGPKIGIIKIPKQIIIKINKEVDSIISSKSRSKKNDYSKISNTRILWYQKE